MFNLAEDQHERANLSQKNADVFQRLKADFAEWNKTMLPYPAKSFSELLKPGPIPIGI